METNGNCDTTVHTFSTTVLLPSEIGSKPKNSLASMLVRSALSMPGQPLDPSTQLEMESLFGYDFANVRIHTGPLAGLSAQALGSAAFARGHDIVFAPGYYQPHTLSGRRLLAHELAHVVQQRNVSESAPEDEEDLFVCNSQELEMPAVTASRRVAAGLHVPMLAALPRSSRQVIHRVTHTSRYNLWDPQECWAIPNRTPDPGYIVAVIVAQLELPDTLSGSITMRTIVTTSGASVRVPGAPPGGATAGFFGPSSQVRFGFSEGGSAGTDLLATRSIPTEMEYSATVPLPAGRSFTLTRFMYVKMIYNANTLNFVEVMFQPRVEQYDPEAAGRRVAFRDVSPNPVVRYAPCGTLAPSPRPT